MAVNIYSSSPQVILTGINDQSTRIVPPQPEVQPQHLPFFYAFTEKGREEPFVVTGDTLVSMYGTKFLDTSSEFATHATSFIKALNEESNLIMIQRLKPEGAKTAWLRFALEVSVGPVFNEDRTPVLNEATGKMEVPFPVPKVRDETLSEAALAAKLPEAYHLRWIVNPTIKQANLDALTEGPRNKYLNSNQFGRGLTVKDIGTVTGEGGDEDVLASGVILSGDAASRVYPIFDLEVTDFGKYGNNLGVRLSAPNWQSRNRPDRKFFESTLVRQFRIEFIRRSNARAAATTIPNRYGENYTNFVFKRGQVDPNLGNQDVYLGTYVLDLYRNLDSTGGRIPTYGPFNRVKVYDENVEHILKSLYEREAVQDSVAVKGLNSEITKALNENGKLYGENNYRAIRFSPDFEGRLTYAIEEELKANAHWQIDFFTGKSFDGKEYRTIKMIKEVRELKSKQRIIALDETTEHWATGGEDGKMGNREYNKLVESKLLGFENPAEKMLDLARYPFSVFYDTGYPKHVKESIVNLIRARKDVSICLATHEVPEDPNDYREEDLDFVGGVSRLKPVDEAAKAITLANFIRLFPESSVYGTKACRANILMQCGQVIGSKWKGLVPMTYELAMKRAAYMGAPNGKMRAGYGYDQDGIKQLRYVKEVNNTFIPQEAREQNWSNGATWAQYYDRNTMFFPAVRTIYKEETSVLLSDINMLIATDLEKVCFRVWRRLVGNAKLSNAQFAALSDQYILEDVEGRYDSRVVIKPRTYYTEADELRGFSWHCEIHMYAPNMKTVGVMTVVTHRLEDLQG